MDVMLLGKNSLRIKGKKASFIIDPASDLGKTETDFSIKLNNSSEYSTAKLDGSRVDFSGPGEYEVGGIKISLIKANDERVGLFDVDGLTILTGSGAALEKVGEKVETADAVIVNATGEFDYSQLPTFEPKVLVVYGNNRDEVKKALGKEGEVVAKFSAAKDKLGDEMQFVLLG